MKSSKKKMLRMENLRRLVQVLVFLAFLSLFFLTIGRYDALSKKIVLGFNGPVDVFFRIDPLLGLTTMLSTRYIIPQMLVLGLVTVVVTVFAGRFFCGWVCPLGTAIDVSDKIFFRKRKAGSRGQRSENAMLRNTKYYILAGIVIASLFSSQFAYLLDPITIITRAFTLAIYPMLQLASLTFGVNSPLIPEDVQYLFRLNFFAAISFIGILAAGAVSRRFWCRNLCPLGALLGVLSRFSIVRRQVDEKCVECSRCVPDCRTGAINENPTKYQASECIYCYSCTNVCPALSTRIAPAIKSEGCNSELDLNRRRIFQAAGIGALVAVLGRTNAAAKTAKNGKTLVSSAQLIRPPGSLPEDEFVDRCMRCSECMKVCPTGGLQPSLTEAGFEGLWSPVLVPKMGECTQNCNLCSQVCASGAIQPFEVLEKPHIFIGTAVIDRSSCIVWNSDKQCLVCDEHCSYHALHWKTVDGIRRPFVDEHKCVGCGICENACPIQPQAAIRVFSFGDKRHMTREQQKAFFKQSENKDKESGPESGSPY